MTHQIIRLAEAVTITPHTDIEVVRLVEAAKASGPQIIRTIEELEALDPDTVIETLDGARVSVSLARRWSDLHIPAVVLATGEDRRAARKALGATDV